MSPLTGFRFALSNITAYCIAGRPRRPHGECWMAWEGWLRAGRGGVRAHGLRACLHAVCSSTSSSSTSARMKPNRRCDAQQQQQQQQQQARVPRCNHDGAATLCAAVARWHGTPARDSAAAQPYVRSHTAGAQAAACSPCCMCRRHGQHSRAQHDAAERARGANTAGSGDSSGRAPAAAAAAALAAGARGTTRQQQQQRHSHHAAGEQGPHCTLLLHVWVRGCVVHVHTCVCVCTTQPCAHTRCAYTHT
jgi:hypothetical protein